MEKVEWLRFFLKIIMRLDLVKRSFTCFTRIMINKGMVNKGKYWILEKNKGLPVSFWKILKGFFQIEYSNFEGYKGIDKGNQYSISKEIKKILSTCPPVKHPHSS